MDGKSKVLDRSRAWIELDLEALTHNIKELTKILPLSKIVAVVKANAYGHGMIEIAQELEKLGIKEYAVATLEEAITLRKNNIKGNILILGYTRIEDISLILTYNLTQTIVDYDYALQLSKLALSKKLKVEIKINTGMNRLGEKSTDIDKIKKIYHLPYLEVNGIFSHFAVSDESMEESIQFSKQQIFQFENLIKLLKEDGYQVGRVHLQSSYGLLNYSEFKGDCARIGIIMYGVHSSSDIIPKVKLELKPVLSLKARVASVKMIDQGVSVSYGRSFISPKPMKIATICIGYADGYPRSLSSKEAYVKIGDSYARVIGRICMDQCMIDVTEIKDVLPGSIVTVIGKEEKISACYLAKQLDTITNEVLSRLSTRLNRVVIR